MNKKLRRVLTQRDKTVDLECLNCGHRFSISRASFNVGQGFFHDRKCAAEFAQEKRRIKMTQTTSEIEFPKSEKGAIKRLIERAAKMRDSIEENAPREAPRTREVKV